jgi:hypothetical protein
MLAWLSLHTDAASARDPGRRTVIWGDEDRLRGTYLDSEHTLQIGDGRRIPKLLTDLKSNSAEFRTTGSIPGFQNSFAKAHKV